MAHNKAVKKVAFISLLVLICAPLLVGGQPGVTDTVFNRRFISTIKPMMTFAQVVKLAGGPGLKVEGDAKFPPGAVQYRWKGGRDSVLTVTFRNDKMMEATILAPNKHTYRIQENGGVVDITR